MAHSLRTLRLVSASALALLMVAGTYLATGPSPFFGIGRIASAQSAEELLREYAGKDTDDDGLPDWQEALYGTDPANPESFQAGIPDGEAVAQGLIQPKVTVRPEGEPTDLSTIPGTVAAPSSLTDRFSQTLLKQYLLNRGENPPTPQEITAFVQSGVADLVASYQSPQTYTAADMRVSGTVYGYVVEVERILLNTGAAVEKNELFYAEDYIRGDKTAKQKIINIAGAYLAVSELLSETEVPQAALQSHVRLANAFSQLSSVTADMAALETDPLRALLALALYDKAAADLFTAMNDLGKVMDAYQIKPGLGEPGRTLYEITHTPVTP